MMDMRRVQQDIDERLIAAVCRKLELHPGEVTIVCHRPVPRMGSMTVPVFRVPDRVVRKARGLGLEVAS